MADYLNLIPPSDRLLLADYVTVPHLALRRCSVSDDHFASSRRLSDLALQVKHDRCNEMIIWAKPGECVVHEQLVSEMKQRNITGYRLRAATVRFRGGYLSKDYQELVVVGWAGVAPPESGIHLLKSCPACQWRKYSGLTNADELIDWGQWTGEDFFMVWPLPLFILITERVRGLLHDLDAKSYSTRRLGRAGIDGFYVGPLSDCMPKDLAKKYGPPLGLGE